MILVIDGGDDVVLAKLLVTTVIWDDDDGLLSLLVAVTATVMGAGSAISEAQKRCGCSLQVARATSWQCCCSVCPVQIGGEIGQCCRSG